MKKLLYILLLALVSLCAQAAPKQSYYFQRAEQAYQDEDLETALRYAEKGVQENKKDGYCWAMMAEIYSKRAYARYAEALEASEKALPLLKKDKGWTAFMYCVRGDIFYKIGEMELARDNYTRALLYDSDFPQCQISLADVYHELKNDDMAITLYESVIQHNPQYSYIHAELAECLLAKGDTAAAERNLNYCNYITEGGNIKSHILLSNIALSRHQWPLACQEMAKAMFAENGYEEECDSLRKLCPELLDAAMLNELETRSSDIQALNTMGIYHYVWSNYVEATQYTLRAAALTEQPAQQGFTFLLMNTYMQLDLEQAVSYAKQTIEADSTVATLYYYLADIYGDLGRHEEAIKAYRKAIELNPSDADYYRLMGRQYISLGDLDKALACMDSATLLTDNAEMPTCLFNRAEVLRMQGKEDEAVALLNDALALIAPESDRSTTYYIHALLGHTTEVNQYADSIMQKADRNTNYISLAQIYACLHDKEGVLRYIDLARQNGYRNGNNFSHYFRMSWLKDDPDFLAAIERYEADRLADLERLNHLIAPEEAVSGVTEIPFTRQGGVNQVKCSINGLPLYFVFDTGAADVSISSVEANFMLKNGYLSEADFLGKQNFVSATGEIHEGTIINLREVRVGDIVLKDVKASVVKSQHAPLLLGQSVFRRFGTLEVDNENNIIRLIGK